MTPEACIFQNQQECKQDSQGAAPSDNPAATLTRGDEVSFPIAVYNYLDTAQTVRVEMQAADWFTPLGGTGMDIDLGPGQVTGVRFPVPCKPPALPIRAAYGIAAWPLDRGPV